MTELTKKRIEETEIKIEKRKKSIKKLEEKVLLGKDEWAEDDLKIARRKLLNLEKLLEKYKVLGKKGSPDGLYTRFLEINGFKKDSALQHRKKYELWEKTKSDRTKQIIALLSLKDCEKLYKVPELLIDIEENKTITLEEVKNLLSPSKQITEKTENEIEEFDFNIMLSFQEKFEKLEENKKQEVTKLLLKIEKIMGSN